MYVRNGLEFDDTSGLMTQFEQEQARSILMSPIGQDTTCPNPSFKPSQKITVQLKQSPSQT